MLLRFSALALLLAAGCVAAPVAGAPSSPAAPSPFPTKARLEEVKATPLPPEALELPGVMVDQWKMEGPLPERFGAEPYSDASPFTGALNTFATQSGGRVQVTGDMHCAARELGRFVLAKDAVPSDELRDFITGRCGVVGAEVRMQWSAGEMPRLDEGKVFEQWSKQFGGTLEKMVGPGPRAAGIWFGRDGKRIIILVASSVPRVRLEPGPRVPDAQQHITLRGELLVPGDRLQALVNQGPYGYGTCLADASVALPHFALTCSVLPSDSEARVELAAFPPGRIFGPIVLDLVGWPGGKASLAFSREQLAAPSAPASTEQAMLQQLLVQVNTVRAHAQLRPMVLADKESAVSNQIAPYYFAAMAGKAEAALADEVALGLRAGWDVDGQIRDAEFASAALGQTRDPARLVQVTLERPSGRAVLLDRDAAQLAVGQVTLGKNGLGAVLTSYTLFDERDVDDGAATLAQRLTAQRAARGLPAPHFIQGLEAAQAQARTAVRVGAAAPDAALQYVLQAAVQQGRAFSGLWMTTSTLDFELPKQLLQPGPLDVCITVSHRRAEGQAWGQYVVLFAFPRPQEVAWR
ncbi:MAG: hypothetical protein JST54_09005 [Deltaproteobacteria bacterium]|nr:hypothetical protein [Deltaproteobacteria bacterium]